VGGLGGSFIFFTWVVGFLINKILWVVGDIKIKISCLVCKRYPSFIYLAMLLLGRLITRIAPRRRGGKLISVSGDRGDNAIT
jgi:uncharacterized membrane protein